VRRYFKYFARKRGFRVVIAVILALLAGAICLGILSAKEMERMISEDFNAQQLALAQHTAAILEQSFTVLKRELLTLSLSPSIQYVESVSWPNRMKISLSTIRDYGVFRIILVDTGGTQMYSMDYNQALYTQTIPRIEDDYYTWCQRPENRNKIYISKVKKGVVENSDPGLTMIMATPVYQISPDEAHPIPTQKFSGVLAYVLNAGAMARQFVAPIRSGKTGYGWVINESGDFLYHLEEKFIGQTAFEARKFKDPYISFTKINMIQKDKMLQGEQGTSWYISGWHRGQTGPVEKLIAFAPVKLGAANAQRIWSIAVVAPSSEVDVPIRDVYKRQAMIQGVFTTVSLLILIFLILNEKAWLKTLEQEVLDKTKDLKEYAKKLKQSQRRYRSLVESADDMIYTVDEDLHIWSTNRTWSRLTGINPQQALGQCILDIIEYGDPDKVGRAVTQALSSGRTVSQEEGVRIGEKEYFLDTKYTPFTMDSERAELQTVLVVSRDITEHRKIESQLFNTEKLASLGSLSAGVAHEINNPIAVILGFTELLQEKMPAGSKEQEILQAIERQGNNCRKIVENLLAFARIPQEVISKSDVAEDLRKVLDVVRNTLVTQNIDLNVHTQPDLPKVNGDGPQLEQVFLNIINNAVSAMKGGGVLTVNAWATTGMVHISFKDTGHGISRRNLKKVFEPFFTTKKVGEGTGLGLAVSYGIIKKFGGEIHVDSQTAEEGKQPGTTFRLSLPIAEPEDSD
jgi:two-component system, NtrC family, sensor kinase